MFEWVDSHIRRSDECFFSLEIWYCCCSMMCRQSLRTWKHTGIYVNVIIHSIWKPGSRKTSSDNVVTSCFTFLVCWGRMTPSSQSLPEEKNAELSSINLMLRSSSCSPSEGSRESEWPGATIDTLALGHRNRKFGSKARPHWRQKTN